MEEQFKIGYKIKFLDINVGELWMHRPCNSRAVYTITSTKLSGVVANCSVCGYDAAFMFLDPRIVLFKSSIKLPASTCIALINK